MHGTQNSYYNLLIFPLRVLSTHQISLRLFACPFVCLSISVCEANKLRSKPECGTTEYNIILVEYGKQFTHIIHNIFMSNPKGVPGVTACGDLRTLRAFTREL